MPNLTISDEEVDACFELVLKHLRGNGVAAYPFELRLIIERRAGFVAQLADQLRNGAYRPSAAPIAEAPKGEGALRPLHLLSFRDQVAYAALGLKCLPNIVADLGTGTRPADFSYRIKSPIDPTDWFLPYFKGWRYFGEVSLRRLDEGATVVVETDISGFYENIDHALLFSELRRIGVSDTVIAVLRMCLNTWIPVRRGLPQGNLTSAAFAKLYLHSVDQLMSASGFIHNRYSDDMRLFCKSKIEAKKALQTLIGLLRDKTLTIQTAKTRFMDADVAAERFRGVTPLIERIRATFTASKARERQVAIAFSADYMSLAELIREASESADVPIEVIIQAYIDFILDKVDDGFNKSTFHYLIGRLSYARNNFAVDDCLKRFVPQPQETRLILRHLLQVGITAVQEAAILDFLEHDENIYPFQTFEILQYLSTAPIHDVGRISSIARRFAFGASPLYLKSQARFLLFRVGSNADTEAMYRVYVEATSPVERAELICAISRMEPGRRNAFYSSVEQESWIIEAAIAAAKAGRIKSAPTESRSVDAGYETPADSSNANETA